MCRKLLYLTLVALVLGLSVEPSDVFGQPGLIGYWKFDETAGTTAIDSAGGDNNGTLVGTEIGWAEGISEGALSQWSMAETTEGVEFPTTNMSTTAGTVAMWAYLSNPQPQTSGRYFFGHTTDPRFNDRIQLFMQEGTTDSRLLDLGLGDNHNRQNDMVEVPMEEWVHVALTWDSGSYFVYFNGQEVGRGSYTGLTAFHTTAGIGNDGSTAPYEPFAGLIDEVKLYLRALSAAEIQQAMRIVPRGAASKPNPPDKATDVSRDVVLSWTPGQYAAAVNGHIVYIGENFGDVNDATGGTPQSAPTYDPGRLAFGTTYYWRIDEVNAPPDSTVYKGQTWSFTTEPVGYPIEGANITATASSSGGADFGPEKTIDGSGLDENGLHSTAPANMWISDSEPQGAWIQYEFDKAYKLHQMWVWNSNQIFEGLFGFGFKEVTVEYSTNGTDWTTLADAPQFAQASGKADYTHNTTIDFGGAAAKVVKLTATSNWGGLLPQYGLSEVRFFAMPVSAREPSPDTGATDVHPDATLSWRAGREAVTHNVYLSTDQQAVIDGTAQAVSVTDTSYSATLNLDGTYYWRIDEVNEAETPTTWQGDVWDFTTQEFILVDGFEDYNDYPPYEIYSTWLDGYDSPSNGSQVGYLTPPAVETTIVHSGKQSMPLIYSNTGAATYSEATRTFAVPQDWTKYGIERLQLSFYGTAGNTGQLYVKINGVKVPYSGDAANLAVEGWLPWDIDLATVGVNLASVTSLTIGIDGNAAAGTLYVDDIRLYGAPAASSSANLVALWQLDNNTDDSSGNGHNGTIEGAPTYATPGRDGTGACMRFGGDTDRITVDSFDVTGTGITLTAWINPASFKNDARMISKSEGGSTSLHYWAMVLSGTGEDNLQFRLRTDVGATTSRTSAEGTEVMANEWTHVAVAWDASDPVMRQYKNGVEIDSVDKAGSVVGTSEGVQIGIGNQSISALAEGPGNEVRPFDGLIDDVRVYDRGLSATEIFQLASQ